MTDKADGQQHRSGHGHRGREKGDARACKIEALVARFDAEMQRRIPGKSRTLANQVESIRRSIQR